MRKWIAGAGLAYVLYGLFSIGISLCPAIPLSRRP